MNTKTKPFGIPAGSLIFKAGLLAGTLDIFSAFAYYYFKTKKDPLNVLTYVSKVALRGTTFSGSLLNQAGGLIIHFTIAFGWTTLFFILYPRIKWMRFNRYITAIVYGFFVWTMMNIVIQPLWNNKAFVYKGESSIVNCLILMLAVGLPLSLIASRHYSKEHL